MNSKYSQPSALGGSFFLFAALTVGCPPAALAPASPAPCVGLSVDECAAKFSAELVACDVQSTSLEQSLTCEDAARAAYGQPPRPGFDAGASDASAPDASDGGTP